MWPGGQRRRICRCQASEARIGAHADVPEHEPTPREEAKTQPEGEGDAQLAERGIALPSTCSRRPLRSPDEVRIVTTNFDRQLWRAASACWPTEPREYVAPALPFGGDMRGIVYLHGAAHDSTKGLVVTDRDFGLAYLTRGHATRFLLDLYAGNAVLFVGYSHSEPILTYLAARWSAFAPPPALVISTTRSCTGYGLASARPR